MNNKIILESLSMDLLRVALGLHRGSYKMAQRFSEEALKRKQEVDESQISSYAQNLLSKIQKTLTLKDQEKKAEDSLMYSTLIRNYTQTSY
jgi:hypothetical protein